ncbi:uncharacterized protein LOC126833055 [Adelges cooleyi]|uniref:uncharacterized protein LOC126833055 n=1 Tax=Adelges cooleyi TaxID=133065 RepID=UPI00217F38DF|nr:uncharacterized protein LOC126833055 [Adelges cooleyi]
MMKLSTKNIVVFLVIIVSSYSSADILNSDLKSHKSNTHYDITVIAKLRKISEARYYCHNPRDRSYPDFYNHHYKNESFWNDICYEVKIHLRKNAIGLPITYDGAILKLGNRNLEFIANDHSYFMYVGNDKMSNWEYVRGEIEMVYDDVYGRHSYEYNHTQMAQHIMSSSLRTDYEYLTLRNVNSESFNINWTSNHMVQGCVSISYVLKDINSCSMTMDIIRKNDSNPIASHTFVQTENLQTLVLRLNESFWKNVEYELRLNLYTNYNKENCIGLKRIAQCPESNDYEEVYSVFPLQKFPSEVKVYAAFEYFSNRYDVEMMSKTETCSNGGLYRNYDCVCPPGFKGDNCTYACGPNKYGDDCFGLCSMKTEFCKGMIMCTKDFNCQCSTGYSGKLCEDECLSGYYGFGCKQKCSENCISDQCNIFSGVCTKGCENGFMMPNCLEKYPWFNVAPKLVSSDTHSMVLSLDLSRSNINGLKTYYSNDAMYYQIMYKSHLNETDFQYTDIKNVKLRDLYQTKITEVIDGLKVATTYTVGAIFISKDGNFNEEDVIKAQYSTTCDESNNITYELKLSNDDPYTITATWKKQHLRSENECKIDYYQLTLMLNQSVVSENKINGDSNSFNFTNLIPGYLYTVQIKAHSANSLTQLIEVNQIVTKPHGVVSLRNINGQIDNVNKSIRLTWELVDPLMRVPLTYVIKYRVNRYLSCSRHVVESNWTSVNVYDRMEYDILDLIPNTQYIINVESSTSGTESYENSIFIVTPSSIPSLAPVMDENHPLYLTNQTATISWTFDKNECIKLNGFFSGYHLVLKNLKDGTQSLNHTKKSTVEYVDLNPDTNYEIRVYIKTNNGFNPDCMLFIPFITKSKFLAAVDDLTVYKKDSKQRTISLRWRYQDNTEVQGFIITITKDAIPSTLKEIRADKDKCTGWPNYYCATISNLMPKDQYTFKIRAKSHDYPEGGLPASVSCNFIDGFSDEPGNLRATLIGSNNITLEWDIPWILNGVLKSFIVNTEEITALDMETCCASLPAVYINVTHEIPTYNCTLTDLKPGSTYSIGVLSKTSWYGQAKRIFVTTLPTSTPETVTKILV